MKYFELLTQTHNFLKRKKAMLKVFIDNYKLMKKKDR